MSKIDHEKRRARQRGRDAARDDPEVALLRIANGPRTELGKLRKVICANPDCKHSAYIVVRPGETRRVRCSRCGGSQRL
jgi:hypothetical protein